MLDDVSYDARRKELADSYLDHVLLILRVNDRGANLRNFLDPWWSFTKGDPFIKGRKNHNLSQHTQDNPCACGCDTRETSKGTRLLHLDWISAGAQDALSRRVCKRVVIARDRVDTRDRSDRLIVEHSVPFAIVVNALFDAAKPWSRDNLRAFLAHHFKRALLTREEDARLDETLNGRSLNADMPQDWSVWGDPYARYHDRGIIAYAER